MKNRVLVVHRSYRHKGGEDTFLEQILVPSLKRLGIDHEVLIFPPLLSSIRFLFRDLTEMLFMTLGFESLRPTYWAVAKKLKKGFSQVVLNNFVPTVSLGVPSLAHHRGAKVFVWTHNARIFCANGLRFDGEKTCEDCLTKGSFSSVKKNCQRNGVQSLMYGFIYRNQRVARIIGPYVNCFLAVSNYAATHVRAALPNAKIQTIYSYAIENQSEVTAVENVPKPFLLYLGRVSFEKGADLFLNIAQKNPQRNFVMAGDGPMLAQIKNSHPKNVRLLGRVEGAKKNWLLRECEALIMPSRVPENAPMAIFETQPYKTPVLGPLNGGAAELAELLGRSFGPADEQLKITQSNSERKQIPSFDQSLKDLFGFSGN